jgi:hypothetical protein
MTGAIARRLSGERCRSVAVARQRLRAVLESPAFRLGQRTRAPRLLVAGDEH